MLIKKCDWVYQQAGEACKTQFVTLRNGEKIPVWMAFRCLYCGEYFNQAGAEEHFGKTRIEFNESHPGLEVEIEVTG